MKLCSSSIALVAILTSLYRSTAATTQTNVGGAIYFISNDPEANHVLTAEVGSDGSLDFQRAVYAGGKGALGNATPRPADALFSGKGAVAVSQEANLLAAVNPGSNSLALFHIDPARPSDLVPIGHPVWTGGDFPMSVTFNKKGNHVCVLNGGAVSGVECFRVNRVWGLQAIPDTRRPLHLNQTTPPSGPPGSASQIIFTDDDSQLVVAVKGAPPASTGYLAVWDVVHNGALSANFSTVPTPQGGALPFSLSAVPGTRAFVAADPNVGFDVFDLDDASKNAAVAVQGQAANCWGARSPKTGHFFLTDPGAAMVNEVAVDGNLKGSVVAQYSQGNTTTALVDVDIGAVGDNEFIFILATGDTTVQVRRVDGPGSTTNVGAFGYGAFYNTTGLGIVPRTAQGMAVWSAPASH
ncbi:hypothetical protein PsYK624_141810 [Phanerochaete sordida]|uniref:3-carboxymuconate cyclase n=1 Tax=Phanerochaete sordida TaxID=48140 RepID=A0A9P3LKS0_9APHY|nr:hypothetical protein PsYK624_141810 [Phanerochaete sordida]